jgi:tetratricopeptide (TPR) repeat protein
MKEKRNYIFIFLAILLSGTVGFSQNVKGKVRKYVRNADIELYNNNFQKALELYRQAYALDTNNSETAYKLGICMYSIRSYKKQSLPYFEKAHRNGIVTANYYLGNLYHLQEKFGDAIRSFQEYKNIPDKKEFSNKEVDFLISKCQTAIEFEHAPVNATIENIGHTINSEYPDYVPVISADESVLIFTSRRPGSTGDLRDPFGEYFEDVYISTKKDSQWTSPKNISKNINTNTHDACVGLSADGELLFLYRTSEDLLSGDLYSSAFDGTDWTVPVKLPSPINTSEYTEPSVAMSADGQTIYFSSNRPGGYGKKDIYKVSRLPNGEWSQATNMGPAINTAEDEDALFVHPDGKIFYFSSKGHKNMGGYDIFKSTLGEDGLWSEAQNLGYPVNTPDDDVFFVLSTDGKTGYYSSVRPDSYGATDIYLVHFEDEDFGLSVFNGLVAEDDTSARPLAARISLFDSKLNKMIGTYNTNKLTGKFIMIIKPGKEYIMQVESEGYVSFIGKITPSALGEINKIKLERAKK